MPAFLAAFDTLLDALRVVFLAVAVLVAVVALVDWLVRTRRIGAFTPVARFFRTTVDPLMAPVERRIVRAGGMPSSAPWWTLAAVVIGGIVIISLLSFLRGWLIRIVYMTAAGPAGIFALLLGITFGLLKIALIVRVVSSWVGLSPYSKWIRWSVVLTEPMLRPLRQFIPPLGGTLDLTPLIAYFGLVLLERLLLGIVVG